MRTIRKLRSARSLLVALAALAIGASFVAARPLPQAALDNGLNPNPADPATPAATPSGQPTDTHGFTVSQAAKAPTPSGFANHGAYVSSIASTNRQNGQHTPPPLPTQAATPSQADDGLGHRP